MFGKLKSAKTKQEWNDFVDDLHDKDKYIYGIRIYEQYPLGKEVLKQINFLINIDVTLLIDENGFTMQPIPGNEIKNYEKKRLKRITVLKEYLEEKDEIETLNLKYHLLTSTLEQIYRLLNFDKMNTGIKEDKKVYNTILKKIYKTNSKDEWIKLEIEYAKYVYKRFFDLHQNYEGQIEYIMNHFSLLHQMIVMIKDGNDNVMKQLFNAEKSISAFKGNPIEKRKSDKIQVYRQIIACIKSFELNYKAISGIQNKACIFNDIEPSTFSKWKNKNILKYTSIYSSINEMEIELWNEKIKTKYF